MTNPSTPSPAKKLEKQEAGYDSDSTEISPTAVPQTASMSPEAQRAAIAQACGWSIRDPACPTGVEMWVHESQLGWRLRSGLPDYLTDLNAMHAAEKTLDHAQLWAMTAELARVIKTDTPIAHATAAQRAEAFLRTIGKWTAQ